MNEVLEFFDTRLELDIFHSSGPFHQHFRDILQNYLP